MIELIFKDYDSTGEMYRVTDPDVVPRIDDCVVVYNADNNARKWTVKSVTHTYFTNNDSSDAMHPDAIVIYISKG